MPIPAEPDAPDTRFARLTEQSRMLKRDNRELTEHVDLAAVAVIRRLRLERDQLLRQLEVEARVTRIEPTRRR